jgi:hypothetical protein
MGNRIFVAVVIGLWASTMSWLMVARILPPFFQGEPPQHGQPMRNEPVCWEIQYSGKPIGHAVSQAVAGALGTTEIYSRVILEGIELKELAPQWMGSLVSGLGEISLDLRNRVVLDSLGHLTSFDTRVRLNDMPLVMKAHGVVDGADLVLKIQSGELTLEKRYPVPSDDFLSSELMPEPKLLQVYVGRKWQQEMFSPFQVPTKALELMEAEVVEEGPLEHRGERVIARKIQYRSMSDAGVAADNTVRAMLWVGEDGMVLRHDVYLMNATKLRFERCHELHMLKLATELLDLESVATLGAPQSTE